MSSASDKPSALAPVEMPADRDAAKGDARASRLVLKKTSEEDFRQKFYEDARHQCDEFARAFSDCAKANNMMVVLKCREENRKLGACLDVYSTEDRFVKFMDGHGYDHVKVSMPGMLFGSEERAFFRKRLGATSTSTSASTVIPPAGTK